MRPDALGGIRILELGRVPPAEIPGMMLSDMGADVVKIETPAREQHLAPDQRRDAAFSYTNRNKRSIVLDMKSERGAELFRQLAAGADVIIEGFRPGVMARLGAGYEAVREFNPRIVYCSISGFGQDGPYRTQPAHDLNFLALSGALGIIGQEGDAPSIPLNLVADNGGAALHATLGIMLALFARERSGHGQYVDVSYLDATIALLAATPNLRRYFSSGAAPRRGAGVFSGAYPYYSIYDTRDEKQLTVACSEPWLWEKFCRAIGRPDFVRYGRQTEHYGRAPNEEEAAVRLQVAEIMRERDRDDWSEMLILADACVGKVYSIDEMVLDQQVLHRRMVVDLPHPEWGPVRQFGSPIKFSENRAEPRTAAPAPGEHTDEVLRQLGLTQTQINQLRERAIVA